MPRHEDHEEHENLEAWVIPYADLLTLLLAMFIALAATSTADLRKLKELSNAFASQPGVSGDKKVVDPGITQNAGQGVINGTNGVLDGGSLSWPVKQVVADFAGADKLVQANEALAREQQRQADATQERTQLQAVGDAVSSEAQKDGFADKVQLKTTSRGLTITLLTDQVLFDAGSGTMNSAADPLIDGLGAALKGVGNTVEVVGHTDSTPISTSQFPSNWELSGARASSVARYLIERVGLPADRVRASGVADTQPIADNSSPAGRAKNRRVEITVLSNLPTSTSSTATGATDGAATAGGNGG